MATIITEYKVVSTAGLDKINNAVNEQIGRGWVPLGGINSTVTILQQEGGRAIIIDFNQAMVTYEDTVRI
jgi:hypothetical protein